MAFVAVVLLLFSHITAKVYGEEKAEAKESICLESVEGTVTVYKANQKKVKTTIGMKLYQDYQITTSAESYAIISLDSKKLIKMDASTQIHIGKSGKKLQVLIDSGSVFFDVTEALQQDEQLNVKTSNMTMGIRGTAGTVSSILQKENGENISQAVLFTGKAQITYGYQNNASQNVFLEAGHVVTVAGAESALPQMQMRAMEKEDAAVKPFAAIEIMNHPELREKMQQQSGLDIDTIQPDAEAKLKQEQESQRKEALEIQKELDKREKEKNVDSQPTTSSGGKSSSKGDSSNQVEKKLQEALNQYLIQYQYTVGKSISPTNFYTGSNKQGFLAQLEAPQGQSWLTTGENGTLDVVALPDGESITVQNIVLKLYSANKKYSVSKQVSVILESQESEEKQEVALSSDLFYVADNKLYLNQPAGYQDENQILLYSLSFEGTELTSKNLYQGYYSKQGVKQITFEENSLGTGMTACLGEWQEGFRVDIVACKKMQPQKPVFISPVYHKVFPHEEKDALQEELNRFTNQIVLAKENVPNICISDLVLPDAGQHNQNIAISLSPSETSYWLKETGDKASVIMRAFPITSFPGEVQPQQMILTVTDTKTNDTKQKEVLVELPHMASQWENIVDNVTVDHIAKENDQSLRITLSGLENFNYDENSYVILYDWSELEQGNNADTMYMQYFEGKKDNIANLAKKNDSTGEFSIKYDSEKDGQYLHILLMKETNPLQPKFIYKFSKKVVLEDSISELLEQELELYESTYSMGAATNFVDKVSAQNLLKANSIPNSNIHASLQVSETFKYVLEENGELHLKGFAPSMEASTSSDVTLVLEWKNEKGEILGSKEKNIALSIPYYFDMHLVFSPACTVQLDENSCGELILQYWYGFPHLDEYYMLYTVTQGENGETPAAIFDRYMRGDSDVIYAELEAKNLSEAKVPVEIVRTCDGNYFISGGVFQKPDSNGMQKAICYGQISNCFMKPYEP